MPADSERQSAMQRDALVRRFTDHYLRHDGVFLLRLIAHNTNGITTTEITRELWDLWYDHQEARTDQPHKADINEFQPLRVDRAVD